MKGKRSDGARPGPADLLVQRKLAPGKRSRVAARYLVQAKEAESPRPQSSEQIQTAATEGVDGASGRIPHADTIIEHLGEEHRPAIEGIQAQVGGPATDAAQSIGAAAYATGDKVGFARQPDLHTAAHEATHVLQQRSGVSLEGGVGEVGDQYEQHADAVADRVVAGQSARDLMTEVPAAGAGKIGVQRFVEPEHKELGDAGSGGETYKFGAQEFTHGDLVLLSGDHFSPEDLLRLLNAPSAIPGRLPYTQDELIYALYDNLGTSDPRFAPGGKWSHLSFSAAVKQSVEARYYALASQNDNHFANPHAGTAGGPGSSHSSYRGWHEAAIVKAYQLGAGGHDIQEAMVMEGLGGHFLTDSFAAGHVSTPRTSISEHWNGKYPDFGTQFVDKLVNDISEQLGDDATGMSDMIPVSKIKPKVREMVTAQLGSKPLPKLGDIVGLMTHKADNDAGLWMVNDLGWRWLAFGDGGLHKTVPDDGMSHLSNLSVATTAVQIGCDEVRIAHSYGKRDAATPLPHDQILDQVKQATPSPAMAGAKYGPEQLMPRIDTSFDQGTLGWNVDTLRELWIARVSKHGPADLRCHHRWRHEERWNHGQSAGRDLQGSRRRDQSVRLGLGAACLCRVALDHVGRPWAPVSQEGVQEARLGSGPQRRRLSGLPAGDRQLVANIFFRRHVLALAAAGALLVACKHQGGRSVTHEWIGTLDSGFSELGAFVGSTQSGLVLALTGVGQGTGVVVLDGNKQNARMEADWWMPTDQDPLVFQGATLVDVVRGDRYTLPAEGPRGRSAPIIRAVAGAGVVRAVSGADGAPAVELFPPSSNGPGWTATIAEGETVTGMAASPDGHVVVLSLAVDAGRVTQQIGTLLALDGSTGKELWRQETGLDRTVDRGPDVLFLLTDGHWIVLRGREPGHGTVAQVRTAADGMLRSTIGLDQDVQSGSFDGSLHAGFDGKHLWFYRYQLSYGGGAHTAVFPSKPAGRRTTCAYSLYEVDKDEGRRLAMATTPAEVHALVLGDHGGGSDCDVLAVLPTGSPGVTVLQLLGRDRLRVIQRDRPPGS